MIYSEVLSQKYSRIQIVKYELNKRDQKDRVLVDHDLFSPWARLLNFKGEALHPVHTERENFLQDVES